jgi:hypothetical protein
MTAKPIVDDQYSDEEVKKRFEAEPKGALKTPPKPLKSIRVPGSLPGPKRKDAF